MLTLVIALAYFAVDKFFMVEPGTQANTEQAAVEGKISVAQRQLWGGKQTLDTNCRTAPSSRGSLA